VKLNPEFLAPAHRSRLGKSWRLAFDYRGRAHRFTTPFYIDEAEELLGGSLHRFVG